MLFLCPYRLICISNKSCCEREEENFVCSKDDYFLISSKERCVATGVRILTGTKRREHIPPVLTSLHLPPLHTRIDFKLLLLVYKALIGCTPKFMSDLL